MLRWLACPGGARLLVVISLAGAVCFHGVYCPRQLTRAVICGAVASDTATLPAAGAWFQATDAPVAGSGAVAPVCLPYSLAVYCLTGN
jgi:hypothetical protein